MTPSLLTSAVSLFAATSTTQKSNPLVTFLPLIVIAVAAYFFFLRPQQQRAKRQREQVKQFEVGNEVLTAGGIVGHIIDIQDDRVTLETSVGASFVVLLPYILRRLDVDPDAGLGDQEHDGEDDDEEYAEHDGEYDDQDFDHDGGDDHDHDYHTGDESDDHDHGDDRGPTTSR